jgi:hypothetical protein
MNGDQILIRVDGTTLGVTGGTFQQMLAAVKNLPGRRFVGGLKLWDVSGPLADVSARLEAAGYQLTALAVETRSALEASPRPEASRDQIRVRIEDHIYHLLGGTFQEMLAEVKAVDGRRFSSAGKLWELPGNRPELGAYFETKGYRLETDQPATAEQPPSQPQITLPLPEPSPDAPDLPFIPDGEVMAAPEEPPFLAEMPVWPDEPPPDLAEFAEPPVESKPPGPTEPAYLAAGADQARTLPGPANASRPAGKQRPDQIKVRLGDKLYAVSGGTFREMLAVVKSIPGRRFVGEAKVWELAGPLEQTQEIVTRAGYRLLELE